MINWINNATSTNGSSSTVTLNPNAAGFISMDVLAQISTLNGTFMKMEQKPGMPPEFFFKLMKKKMGVLKDRSYRKYLGKIEKMVDKANKDGQIAYSEDLMREFYVLLREAEMYGANFRIFLSEEIFDKFKYKTKRPMRLTPLDNYSRPIPQYVLDRKDEADKFKLFDSYLVMHYDDNKTVKDTEMQKKEKREKDPILFGKVEFSEKLYYIEDWEDEFCDLTLDDIISATKAKDSDMVMSKNPVLKNIKK